MNSARTLLRLVPPLEGPINPVTFWSHCFSGRTQKQLDSALEGLRMVNRYVSIKGAHRNRDYSNIERESLGLVWRLEGFHYFIYGKHCTVQKDCKPLEVILRKKLFSCPVTLQIFVQRAHKYDVKVTFVKGTDVPIADALSRVSP